MSFLNLQAYNKDFKKTSLSLEKGSQVYIMGICGTAMSSLAGILKLLDFKVSGSDQNMYPPVSDELKKMKIPVHSNYQGSHITKDLDLVIVGNVISKSNVEAKALLDSQIPFISFPDFMSQVFLSKSQNIVIAGTHGKSTLSSLVTWALEYAQKKPSYLIGALPSNLSSSFCIQKSPEDFFVIEGDEYDTAFFQKVPKFIFYKAKYLILTSLEFDHADIYKDF